MRGRHAGGAHEAVGVGQEQGRDRAHHLRAVEEREPLLRFERQWLQAGLAKGDRAPARPARELDVATTDERQRQMGERREVADAPTLPCSGTAGGCRPRQQSSRRSTSRGEAASERVREGVGAQQEHQPAGTGAGERRHVRQPRAARPSGAAPSSVVATSRSHGQVVPALIALREAGLEPLTLEAKEGARAPQRHAADERDRWR